MALAARIDVSTLAQIHCATRATLTQEQCLEVWVFHSWSLGQAVNAVEMDVRSLRAMVDC